MPLVFAVNLNVKSNALGLVELISKNLSEVSEDQVERCTELILSHRDKKIFIMGAGRSGLVGRAFAVRLLHLGYRVHVVGETIIPSVSKDDLLIAISGSGSTMLVMTAVDAAKHVGATIIGITSYLDSPLGKIADFVLQVKGRMILAKEVDKRDYFARQILGLHEPLAPLGTLFEDTCMILLDAIISYMMKKLNLCEEDLGKCHANIE
ncbi:MAG: 6-phospho-3-hexuloisomerase [Candidatus Methylarchaceae archaeon HK01M]|nr:6-phospho-3-hexuloisomerase [Candidatus Methylarchaceae archaeon HK01M]